jgi:hypothetical protein
MTGALYILRNKLTVKDYLGMWKETFVSRLNTDIRMERTGDNGRTSFGTAGLRTEDPQNALPSF